MPSEASDHLRVHVTMLSDWHIGIGAGRQHAIDRLIARDADDLPYVPASTLRGLWRDAAETLALGLDNGKAGQWSALVSVIFGTEIELEPARDASAIVQPRPSGLFCSSLHLHPELKKEFVGAEHAARRDVLTFVKPGVEIDRQSGVARDDHLRFDEVATSGLVLTGRAWLDGGQLAGVDVGIAKRFLIAAAALIERLGAKRRRGLGRCAVKVSSDGIEFDQQLIDTLASAPPVAREPSEPRNAKPAYGRAVEGRDGEWHVREFRVELLSPVVIPDEVLGNVVTTQHCLPGSYLLAVVARAAESAGVGDIVASGRLQVLTATPEIDGQRSLPVPLCWELPKDKAKAQTPRSVLVPQPSGEQYKPQRKGFVVLTDGAIALLDEPALRLTTHNVVEDQSQRPTESVGGVYSYEAIAEGQTFRTTVRFCGDGNTFERLTGKLDGSIRWIGRGKPSGYGRVRISIVEDAEQPRSMAPNTSEEFIDVWFLSDLILRSDILEFGATSDAIARYLSQRVNVEFSVESHAVRTRRVESWHSRWGLPRPTIVAVQAGSAMRLRLPSGVARDQLAEINAALTQLATAGLGERCAEGFGQVRFNDPALTQPPGTILPAQCASATRVQEDNLSGPSNASYFSSLIANLDRATQKRADVAASPRQTSSQAS